MQAVGLSIAVAIALHNIPEGVAVALPVYFATKSRWTGFKYAALSGDLSLQSAAWRQLPAQTLHCSWYSCDYWRLS